MRQIDTGDDMADVGARRTRGRSGPGRFVAAACAALVLTSVDAAVTRAAGESARAARADVTAPRLRVVSPAEDAYLATCQPRLHLAYQDDGDVDLQSLRVSIDGVDRTEWFSIGPREAVAEPAPERQVAEGRHRLEVRIADGTGHVATATSAFTVDTIPPQITVVSPASGELVATASIDVSGGFVESSPITVVVAGTDAFVKDATFLARAVALGDGSETELPIVARDAAGNATRASVRIRIERRAPVVKIISPAEGATVGGRAVRVEGTVMAAGATEQQAAAPLAMVEVHGQRATIEGERFRAEVPLVGGQEALELRAVAVSAAGLRGVATVSVRVDGVAPQVVLDEPQPGFVVREAQLAVRGRVDDPGAKVVVNGVRAEVERGVFAAEVPLPREGTRQIVVTASDAVGNRREVSVPVRVDHTPPRVRVLNVEENTAVDGRALPLVGTVEDGGAVSVTVNGLRADRLGRGWQARLPRLAPGPQVLEIVARDEAGNETTIRRPVTVREPAGPTVVESSASVLRPGTRSPSTSLARAAQALAAQAAAGEGVVIGQVLSDTTGLPIEGASVHVSPSGQTTTTDESGLFSFAGSMGPAILGVEKDGMTSAWREVTLEEGVGVVAIDARLTPLGETSSLDAAGGQLSAAFPRRLREDGSTPPPPAALTLQVPAGSLPGPTTCHLTPLSAQGLPLLLPLGYSPVLAFELRGAPALLAAEAHVAGLPALPLHLVRHDPSANVWTVVAPSLEPIEGVLEFEIGEAGAWALVVADPSDPPLPIPAAGGALTAAGLQTIPEGATSRSFADPPSLPSSGGTSRGRLEVDSPAALPSGTVVQSALTERYRMVSGAEAVGEERFEDILLFRADVDGFVAQESGELVLAAEIPIVPSQQYAATELDEGRVHLRIMTGREGSRGMGGSDATTLSSGGATLSIPAGSLPEDTAIRFERLAGIDPGAPQPPGMTALAQVQIDLAGATLGLAAELTIPASGAPPGGSFFVARFELVGGETRMQVVAWAARDGEQVKTIERPPLAGIRRGGRYVVYHAAQPIALLAGVVRAAGQPVAALVTTSSTPFVGLAGSDGGYVVLSLTGPVRASARVLGTSLVGTAEADVAAGAVLTLDIHVSQALTTALVTPEPGATNVPVTRQIEVQASAPLDEQYATPAGVRLRRTTSGAVVVVGTVLSADRRFLAVIPQAPLAHETSYTFEVIGLKDDSGLPVAAPEVTFTTAGEAGGPEMNLAALVFSYPIDGVVTMSAPAGAIPAGSDILVMNMSSGGILTYGVGELPISATMRATIDDRLWVSVIDPSGRVTEFERTEYVAPDGRTAVGLAGGTVRGAGGVELRIPAGATDRAVTLKVSSFSESQLPGDLRPDVPGAEFGTGLKIESTDKPQFDEEVDLVFPRPAGAPEGATFYVFRKVDLPGGRVSFETLDHAFAEGDKVKTASPPFSGYTNSFGGIVFGYGGPAVQAQVDNYAILMWHHDQLTPGRPGTGVITGRVVRPVRDPDSGDVAYVGVPGVRVNGVNAANQSLLEDPEAENVASTTTDADGVFAFFEARYSGGLIKIAAYDPDPRLSPLGPRYATAYQSGPSDPQNAALRSYPYIARATIALDRIPDPGEEPEPAVVGVTLLRIGSDERRVVADALVVEGARLLVGMNVSHATIDQVRIGDQALPFGDDLAPETQPLRYDLVTSSEFIASPPGTYRLEVAYHDDEGNPRSVVRSFRIVRDGGGRDEPDPDSAPRVLSVFPSDGATDVPITAVLQVDFSEPVRNIPGHVALVEIGVDGTEDDVTDQVRLLGLPPYGQSMVEVTNDPAQPLISLLMEPQPGRDWLRFGSTYRLTLSSEIRDLDDFPRPLEPLNTGPGPYSATFATSVLADATSTDTFPSPGIAVQNGFAYLVENQITRGILKVFDVWSAIPELVPGASRIVRNYPVDLAAKPARLVVGTSLPARSVPSNLHVFDIRDPRAPEWVGAASVATGALDGDLLRTAVHGSFVYALVNRKGVQVVSLPKAEANFAAAGPPGTYGYWSMTTKLNTAGQGFGLNAVVSTIPLPVDTQTTWRLHDLDVADRVLGGFAQPVVFVAAEEDQAGTCALVVGHPATASAVGMAELQTNQGWRLCPLLVVTGQIAGRDLAVLGVRVEAMTTEESGLAIAVVDVDPENPAASQLLGWRRLGLPDLADIALDGTMALVSSRASGTKLVNLESPENPYVAGSIANLSGSLFVGPDGTYYSTGGTFVASPEGGLHVANRNPQCDLLDLRDTRLSLEAVRDPVDGSLCGGGDALVLNVCEAARVTLRIAGRVIEASVDGAPQSISEVPIGPGTHVVQVPWGANGTGADTESTFTVEAVSQQDPGHVIVRQGRIANRIVNRPVLPVGRTFVKGVDLFDGHLVRQATDVRVQGRHLGLELTRTYSSAAKAEDGVMGAGWSWNYDSAVTPSGCGNYNVSTADGSGQVFRSTDGGQTFTPQRGYHSKLRPLPGGGYEFVDKAGVKHFFKEPVDPAQPNGAYRLDSIVEPHGDRVEVTYDLRGRVSSVREVLRGERPVRSLGVRYRAADGYDRIASVESSLGHRVEYGYDDVGNLTSVTRFGTDLDGGNDAASAVETYAYDTSSTRDPHQMVEALGPNGEQTQYAYYSSSDPLPGETAAVVWIPSKEELVKAVTERFGDGPAEEAVTSIAYDFSQGAVQLPAQPSSIYTTTVTDARGNDTVYTLNIHGSPTRIEEPLGKTTEITWGDVLSDILKESETDAEGRLTRYQHDARGNLTQERIEKGGVEIAVTDYEYEPEFNKLTLKRDAEGRETSHTIDPTTGDLRATVDPVGNRTTFDYDADGCLEASTDPRGFATQFTELNDFCSPREIRNPLGQVTSRSYDARNRVLVERQQPYGRETRISYDGFDRPLQRWRLSGTASGDERTTTEYYPGGQVRATTNALGARTEYTLDRLNRVTGTSTSFEGGVITTAASYDPNGNKLTETDPRGVTRLHAFDALNRLVRTEIAAGLAGEGPTGQIAAYSYDLVGNKTSETDLNGFCTTFEYDGLYQVKTKGLPRSGCAAPATYSEHYVHDAVGNPTRFVDANGKITDTVYDGLNRATSVTRDVGGLNLVTTTTYDDAEPTGSHVNKSEERDVAKGLRTTFEYDALNRETNRSVHLEGEGGGGGVLISTTAYDDSAHARRTSDPRGVVTLTRLDGLDRVIEQTVAESGSLPALSLTTTIEYDGLGNKTAVTDPEERTTRNEYDGLGRLTRTTDAKNNDASVTYFPDGLRASETDRRGVTKLFSYDNLGRPRKAWLAEPLPFSEMPWSHETAYLDGPEPRRIEKDARSNPTTFDLDALGRVIKETDALGHFRTFAWDGVNKIAETDKRNNSTALEYDGINRLVRTTDPAPFTGQTVVVSYDALHNRVTETDRRGIVKVTQMDPLGRVLAVTRAVGTADEAVLETNSYDGNGNKTLAVDAESKKTRFEYDAANRLVSRTDGYESDEAAIATFKYDRAGNVVEEQDARAAANGDPWSVKKDYDELNRLVAETDGESNTTTYAYDPEGNRTSVTTAKGQTTAFEYDELGKLTKVTQPPPEAGVPNPVTEYVYDPNRNRTGQTDANGHVVTMEYDALNRLTKTTQDPAGLALVTQTVEFDANGNPLEIRDPKGQTITSTYDELGRLETKAYAFAAGDPVRPWRHTTVVEYAYDENGNVVRQDETVASGTDPSPPAASIVRTYDFLDRLASETTLLPDGGGKTVQLTYWRNGVRKSTTDPGAGVSSYAYDGQNRLQTVTTIAGTSTYTYFGDGLLETLAEPDGSVATHTYDKADRLLSLSHDKDATLIASYVYTYDANGNRDTQVETNGGPPETTSYGYDDLDRLVSITYPVDTAYPNGRVVTYGYDAVGNRVHETERDSADVVLAEKQGVFDNVNRLTQLDDLVDPTQSTAFTWDPNGNQLTKTVGNGPTAVTTTNVYDIRDKLAEVQQTIDGATSILARYQYDAEGRLLKKIGTDGIRQYVYDQTSRLAEYDENGLAVARFHYGSDRLISMWQQGEGTRFYHLDGLRSVIALTDTAGAVTANLRLDTWGNFRFPTQDLATTANRFAFTGHVFEQETGLYYAKARFLDPKLGRFLTQDSFLGQIDEPPSLHRYAYAANRPTFYIDPTGHILRQVVDDQVNQVANNYPPLIAAANAALNEASYQALDRVSFGALHRQDKLVDQNLSGKTSNAQYYSRTSANVSLSSAQAAFTLGTGGYVGENPVSATAWGAAGGVYGQLQSDLGEIYGTQTKSWKDVKITDYLVSAAQGALGGWAGNRARVKSSEQGPAKPVEGVKQENRQATEPAPAAETLPTSQPESSRAAPASTAAQSSGPSSEKLAHLETRTREVHSVLDPIAQRKRTTVVLGTEEGGTIAGAGARDLSPAQRDALGSGETAARLPGKHGEVTVVEGAKSRGQTPEALKASRKFCDGCRTYLEGEGATIVDPKTAVWEKKRD